jgi:hypothetical protein
LETAAWLAVGYFAIGLALSIWRMGKCGFELRSFADLVDLLIIACTSAILWPVLAYIWFFGSESDKS